MLEFSSRINSTKYSLPRGECLVLLLYITLNRLLNSEVRLQLLKWQRLPRNRTGPFPSDPVLNCFSLETVHAWSYYGVVHELSSDWAYEMFNKFVIIRVCDSGFSQLLVVGLFCDIWILRFELIWTVCLIWWVSLWFALLGDFISYIGDPSPSQSTYSQPNKGSESTSAWLFPISSFHLINYKLLILSPH